MKNILETSTDNKQFCFNQQFKYHYELTETMSKNSFYNHCHSDYEFFLFLNGSAEYNIEGQIYDMKPYTLLIIRPTEYHYLQPLTLDNYKRLVINFSSSILPESIILKLNTMKKHYCFSKNDEIINCFFKLINVFESYTKEDFEIILKTKLIEILYNLIYMKYINTSLTDSENNIPEIIKNILEYVNKNITIHIDLDSISQDLFFSKSYLSHIFKDHMKISLMQYIKQKKVFFAQSLLSQGFKPTKVYEMCGFKDYITFYRVYVSILKHKPSDKINK